VNAADRTKLCNLLGMLGSDHAGEQDNAARAADALVRSPKLTWRDVIVTNPPKREPLFGWRKTCADLLEHRGALRPWEVEFARDLPGFPRIMSEQRYILASIVDPVLGADRTC
jgi:hypothetical protein